MNAQYLVKVFSVLVTSLYSGTSGFICGIILGLNPVFVGIISSTGNIIGVIVTMFAGQKFRNFIQKKMGKSKLEKKKKQVLFVLNKYGVPFLGLVAPLISTIPVIVVGVMVGISEKRLARWSILGICLYIGSLTFLTSIGFQVIPSVLGDR